MFLGNKMKKLTSLGKWQRGWTSCRSLQNENVEHSESENDEEDLESFVQVQFVSF